MRVIQYEGEYIENMEVVDLYKNGIRPKKPKLLLPCGYR